MKCPTKEGKRKKAAAKGTAGAKRAPRARKPKPVAVAPNIPTG